MLGGMRRTHSIVSLRVLGEEGAGKRGILSHIIPTCNLN